MKIRDLMNIITESEKAAEPVNEMFDGIKDFFGIGPNYKQYPDSEVYTPYTKGKRTGDKTIPKIDNHHLYGDLCSVVSYIEDMSLDDPNRDAIVKKMHDLSLVMAKDTGYGAFQIQGYCGHHRRTTREYNAVGWDVDKIYRDKVAAWNRDNPNDPVNESEQLDEILGMATDQIFGLRTTKKQSDQFPNSSEVLQNDYEDNKNDWGQRYNFNRQMMDIETDEDFVRLVHALETDEDGRSYYDQRTEMDMCKPMARRLNHTTGQIYDYVKAGPWNRRHGSWDSRKWAPTDGPNSPYNDPKSFEYDGDNPANDLPGVRRDANGRITYIPGVDD